VTVKVTFDGYEMLFGDSYRTWDDQLLEYTRVFKACPRGLAASPQPWVRYAGLKWCEPGRLQEQLDAEAKGRLAADFVFGPADASAWDRFRKVWARAGYRSPSV
jgi:hypothetical protein